jgi:hypothetical protein
MDTPDIVAGFIDPLLLKNILRKSPVARVVLSGSNSIVELV